MKRSFSESDSDEGEFFGGKEKNSNGVENESLEASARKKRRGEIEKKRRDRINSSLAELRKLVPAALKKQGSTKLEKAEILQLTVEHLRGLKYGGEYTRGSAMTRAFDERITAHQECMGDGKPCLSAVVDNSETAHLSPMSPARRQIVNHLNWSTSFFGGHSGVSPPATGLALSTKKIDPELPSASQTLTAFSSNARDLSKGFEATQGQRIQDWGLSVALNYPLMLPLQAPGLANVSHAPFGQAVPLIDWSMALVAKTNFATPFSTPWAP